MKYFAALILLLPSAAIASEELVGLYGQITTQCYQSAENRDARTACIGNFSEMCMATEEGGYTTSGMTMCAQSELEIWDGFLNDEYKGTMAWAKAADIEESVVFPEFAHRAKALRDAQRAWITFREAECSLEYASWGAGSMRRIAGANCYLTMTAKRTIELREKQEMMQ